jgi:UrcA family protein
MEDTDMKTLAKTLTHSLAAIGLAGAAMTPALATDMQHKTARVAVSDLDLGTASGQKTLDQRVERAVRSVCRTVSVTTGSRIMDQDAQKCLTKARADARLQVAALISNEQRGG